MEQQIPSSRNTSMKPSEAGGGGGGGVYFVQDCSVGVAVPYRKRNTVNSWTKTMVCLLCSFFGFVLIQKFSALRWKKLLRFTVAV